MSRPVIFISYSHQDEKEKNKLLAHLTVLQQQGLIDLWSDDRIAPGANWKEEITAAIEQAQVAILLISANFLSSNFISDNEIPNLLKRRKNEGLVVFPVIAKHCYWPAVDWLTEMKVRPSNRTPIWGAGGNIDKHLAAIAEEVAALVKTYSDTPPTTQNKFGPEQKVSDTTSKSTGNNDQDNAAVMVAAILPSTISKSTGDSEQVHPIELIEEYITIESGQTISQLSTESKTTGFDPDTLIDSEQQAEPISPQKPIEEEHPPKIFPISERFKLFFRIPKFVLIGVCLLVIIALLSWLIYNPSGSIAFESDRNGRNWDIYTLNIGSLIRMTNYKAVDLEPAWFDQTKLAFASDRSGNWDIYEARPDGIVQMTADPAEDREPAYWHNGSDAKLAFATDRNDNWDIYEVRPNGVVQMTDHPAADREPAYCDYKDGAKLVFASDRSGNWDIYEARPDEVVQMTADPAEDREPACSPDGSKLAFASDRDGNWEIYLLDAAGPKRLTNSQAADKNPSWSPDGTQIAFESNRDGNTEIYLMNADGTEQVNQTNNPESDDRNPAWSP